MSKPTFFEESLFDRDYTDWGLKYNCKKGNFEQIFYKDQANL